MSLFHFVVSHVFVVVSVLLSDFFVVVLPLFVVLLSPRGHFLCLRGSASTLRITEGGDSPEFTEQILRIISR